MSALNRFVATLVWIVLLLALLALAAFPFPLLEMVQQQLGQWALSLGRLKAANPTNFLIGQVATATIAALLFGTLIGIELLSGPRRGARIRTAEGGSAELDTSSIGRRLAWHLDQLAEVITVVPSVRSKRGAVDIRLEVETAPDVDVPMKTDEVVDVTRDIIERDMGLRLGKLDVHVRYAPYEADWN